MIVRNEAHIIHELISCVAAHISYWVIVDTGSNDGTQTLIRDHMARFGIAGELHERAWHDFGYNRSEAIALAEGHCDYIWVMDADDIIVGTPDFSGLRADCYKLRSRLVEMIYWRPLLFRDGMPWRYVGVLHETPTCDLPYTSERLEGDYEIVGRHMGGRSLRPETRSEDRDLLLTEIERDPNNPRVAYYLGVAYDALGDYANARSWFARRAQMGGWAGETYYSMLMLAREMDRLKEPWSEVQDAYLRAWAFLPSRAEALYAVAVHYRRAEQYELGYLFARQGAEITFPADDEFNVEADIHKWRLLDEQSVCASWIEGKVPEAMVLNRQLLQLHDIPEDERQRILGNRAIMTAHLLEKCAAYSPDMARRGASRFDAEITVSLSVGTNPVDAELTLNSFLNCCVDSARVGRFVIFNTGLAANDIARLSDLYPFLDFISCPDADATVLPRNIGGRYWLHLCQGWRFFTRESLLARTVDVLDSNSKIYQVGINFGDATELGADTPTQRIVSTTVTGSRYILTETTSLGPAMYEMNRLQQVLSGQVDEGTDEYVTATLDEVFCIADSGFGNSRNEA